MLLTHTEYTLTDVIAINREELKEITYKDDMNNINLVNENRQALEEPVEYKE